ncbi:S8 family serine peptidase [Sphingomonas sp. GV3]|uniref:S8 family peptidase n=1 Tax=Sphingomonas sp. GV3 TaxID=3040671 RepID=UPI00280B2FDE|nr:S8 family serine peptidase [Sphingomonas sp. GV3]
MTLRPAILTWLALIAVPESGAAQSRNPAPAAVVTPLTADEPQSANPTVIDRRILVMLDMPSEHYRPGSDYGATGGYGDPAAAGARRRLAARIARDQGLTLGDAWPMPVLGIDCVIMTAPGDEPLAAVIERLSHLSGVAWSQPLNEFVARGDPEPANMRQPNDRLFAAQPAAQAWHLADLHRMATGAGIRVAVIDSLVDAHHPDLTGRIMVVRDFVGAPAAGAPETHGTAVAGIIAADADNGVGIAGIAPGAHLMALRACWQQTVSATVCDSLSLARALVFAVENGAQVINLSVTGPEDQLIARLIAAARRRGAAVVASVDPRTGAGFPASAAGVVRVSQEGLSRNEPGVYNAPGRDVPTTEPGGQWHLVSGNSYAAAHVSGLLALARQIGRTDRGLVSTRPDGGTVDACRTLLRAGAKGRGC